MADGKVMQKYYPPDFDPEALRRNKDVVRAVQRARQAKRGPGRRMMEMRMMFPFTLFCENCHDFVYVGTKFNSKVERAKGEHYLGIPIWRFFGRCPHCRHQIVFRTDPKNTDYVLEAGGTRTYDSNRDVGLAEAALKQAQDDEVAGDAVKALEVKSYSTAEELKTIEALDELRRINKRLMSRPDELTDFALQKAEERAAADEDAEDAAELAWARDMFIQREFESSSEEESSDEEPSDLPARTAPAVARFFEKNANDLKVDGSQRQPPAKPVDVLDAQLDSLLDDMEPAPERKKSRPISAPSAPVRPLPADPFAAYSVSSSSEEEDGET